MIDRVSVGPGWENQEMSPDYSFQQRLEASLAALIRLRQHIGQLPAGPSAELAETLAELAYSLDALRAAGQAMQQRALLEALSQHERIEAALTEERNMLRTLIDNLPDFVYFKDTLSRFVTANESVARVMGAGTVEGLIGKTDFDFYPVELAARYYSHEQNILQSGQPFINQEEPIIDAQGNRRLILTTKVPLRDHQGYIVGLVGVGRDITELRQAEEALRESEALNRAVLNSLVAHIAVVDERGLIVAVNKSWERFARLHGGDQVDRLGVGVNYLAACRGSEGEIARAGIEAVLKGRRSGFTMEYCSSTPQAELWFMMTVTPLARGGAVISHLDITRQRQAENSLRESQARLEAIIGAATDAIITIDADQQIILFNAAAERLFGYQAHEVIGQPLNLLLPKRYWADHSEHIRHFSQTGVTARAMGQAGELAARRADGQEFLIEAMISQVEVSGQKLYTVILRDVTERKWVESEKALLFEAVSRQREQLRALTGRLAEAREIERKELARELHDRVGQQLTALNLNLNVIQTHLPVELLAGPTGRFLRDSLALVEHTTESIQDLMANLRPPLLDDYGLVAALRWYCSQFAQRVSFSLSVQGEEPEPRLPGPVEHTLFRITQEALTNVAKHAQASRVVIVVNSDAERVWLTISDNGVGFEVSERVKPAGRPSWGLITMVERAEAIGGHCHINSRPGHGTQVIVEARR
jgi:PAS domain S-box-containing protein